MRVLSFKNFVFLTLSLFVFVQDVEARELVSLQYLQGSASSFQRGQIIVKSNERRLYLVLNESQAIRYPVAVGKPGKQWFGAKYIDGKHVQPAWSPPADVKRDNPNLPDVIAGGSSHNPMGERALTLTGGAYAIHGTNRPDSIGKFASYGCIRMLNDDIKDLYERVSVGTSVVVLR